jgi:hypothetical protein
MTKALSQDCRCNLETPHEHHVDVKVAAGSQAGAFSPRATPEVIRTSKGPADITRQYAMRSNSVTITVEV